MRGKGLIALFDLFFVPGRRRWTWTIWIALLAAAGCAGPHVRPLPPVQPGETVAVNYTCRLENGEIIATTMSAVGTDPDQKKSELFAAPAAYGPASITAGQADRSADQDRIVTAYLVALDKAIEQAIQPQLIGLARGRTHDLKLTAAIPPGIPEGTRYLKLARIRSRSKERRISLKTYLEYYGAAPQIGWQEEYDQAFISTVTEVTDQEIVWQIRRNPNADYITPFGSGTIEDKGDHYEIEMDAAEGRLVRSGNTLGRMSSVERRHIILDFGHPFGGQTLTCELEVLPPSRQ